MFEKKKKLCRPILQYEVSTNLSVPTGYLNTDFKKTFANDMILGIKMKPSSCVVMTSTKLHQFCPFSGDETQQEVCTS